MKKSLMLVGAMMVSAFIFAQDKTSMKYILNLDDKQLSSIDAINKKYREKTQEQWKGLNDERQAEINKVLTPEQNQKWTDYKKERADNADKFAKERGHRGRHYRHHGRGMKRGK